MSVDEKRARVTIRTVAEDAGVSVAAVSKVLREAYGVSDALRAKVQASIQKLNYRPNAAARGLRGQTYTLGVLFPDLHNPFFSEVMRGVHARLESTQYHALLGASMGHQVERPLIEAMVDRQMDGLILVGARQSGEELRALAKRVPTVVLGHHAPDATLFDTVNNDDVRGGELVVEHLVEAGFSRIGFLSLVTHLSDQETVTGNREVGYRRAMQRHGLQDLIRVVRTGDSTQDIGNATRSLLGRDEGRQAIFCWTDYIAFEVLSVARSAGLSVPEQLGVVGYDNTPACNLAQNALSSIDQTGHHLGMEAARLLISRIEGRKESEHVITTPQMIVRQSSSLAAPTMGSYLPPRG